MNFRLTQYYYCLILILIWSIFGLFFCYSFLELEQVELKIAIAICGLILYDTVHSFLKNWHLNGRPLLLDWFRLTTFLFIILDFLFMVHDLESKSISEVYGVVNVQTKVALPAILVILTGLAGLRVGQFFATRMDVVNKHSKRMRVYKIRKYQVLYPISISIGFIQIYLLLNGYVGYGNSFEGGNSTMTTTIRIVYLLSPYILLTYCILTFYCNITNRIFISFFILFLVLQVALGFVSGMKENVLAPIILVVIVFLLSGRRISKGLVFCALPLMLLIYPINDNYRYYLNNYNFDKLRSFELAMLETFGNDPIGSIVEGTDKFESRLSFFPILMYSVENESSWQEFKWMDRYIYLPVSWIFPRILIPNKPTSDTGQRLYHQLTGRYDTSITPTTYGWAYFEGGYTPTFLCFFLFGAFISLIEIVFKTDNLFGLMFYSLVLVSLLKVEADIVLKVSGTLQSLLVGFIFYSLLFQKKRTYNRILFN